MGKASPPVLLEMLVVVVATVVPPLLVLVTTVVGEMILVCGVSVIMSDGVLSFLQAKRTQQRNKRVQLLKRFFMAEWVIPQANTSSFL